MKPAGQPEQAGCGEWPKSHILCMLMYKFLCNVNDTRALIGLCLLVTLHLGRFETPVIAKPSLYSAYSNWSLATYLFFYSSKVLCCMHKSVSLNISLVRLTDSQNEKSGKLESKIRLANIIFVELDLGIGTLIFFLDRIQYISLTIFSNNTAWLPETYM